MSERRAYVAGEGPLTYTRVLREAWGMFRRHYLRVALVALVVFVPPQILATILGDVRVALEADPVLIRGLGYVIGLLMFLAIRLFGPVVFAGYLDEAVGHEYFRGHHVPFRVVLSTLPWGRLVVADVILVVGTTVGLALFVLPGLVWLTLFGLIGPVLVQERHGLRDGFQRTFQLARGARLMVLLLVVGLLAIELMVHELVHLRVHDADPWLQATGLWLVSAVVGGIIGLVEVSLATELMARSPVEAGRRGPSA